MDDDIDDMYTPAEAIDVSKVGHEVAPDILPPGLKMEKTGDELEEGEEEGEEVEVDESDSVGTLVQE